jgi:hypothetical protein
LRQEKDTLLLWLAVAYIINLAVLSSSCQSKEMRLKGSYDYYKEDLEVENIFDRLYN